MYRIGIIGGSGLYQIEDLEGQKWVDLETPFGKPSDQFLVANWQGKSVVFLPRHCRGHKISPSNINYRANIYGMKSLGVERIISVSACGSLKEELRPLDFVVPDQFVDRTNQARPNTFFDQGVVVHVGLAEPVCSDLASLIVSSAKQAKLKVHPKATYINMEGPQFSTLAESNLYRSWGMDIIGMTNMVEARLAREAEICYASLVSVTDYDCWHSSHATVTVDAILDNLRKNADNAKKILKFAIANSAQDTDCSCSEALKYAIVTAPGLIPEETKKKLSILISKYIK